ncbi:T1Dc domain-containing protein [Cryptosporidium canis]|uniref:Oxidation resistance protein 1 n=1 Tax=Cryptosporidium canis TaxID=195482 RepID=A0ABQ8P678_9CRYT|nr:T1Dc domain-containing protein [Cryptosporidium canis]KAJ1612639.1 T1Dc domain-containing protein [Cryptosporidium canis]
MGNIKSIEENKLIKGHHDNNVSVDNSWCDLNRLELKKIGNLVGLNDLKLENMTDFEVDLNLVKDCFPLILRRFYLGFFSFYCNDGFGRVKLYDFVKCINSILYCNKGGVIYKISKYIISHVSDEIEALNIALSIAYLDVSFLLCDSNNYLSFGSDSIEMVEYLRSLASYFNFEFIIQKYYKAIRVGDRSNFPPVDSISEFIQDHLPQFTVFMRLAIRVHFDMISDPKCIKNTFNGVCKKIGPSEPTKFDNVPNDSNYTCLNKCQTGRCTCTLNKLKLDLWVDDNSRILSPEHCFVLRCQFFGESSNAEYLTIFQPWNVLYASWKHGLSLHRLVSSIEGYSSHVLFLVKTIDNCIFGAICTGDWKEGNGKYCGDETCLLLSLRPAFSIIRQSGKGRNFMYINTKYEFSPKGIGFGGEPEYSRLWLDSTIGTGTCMKNDLTYNSGMLYSPINNSGKRNSCLLLGTPFSEERDESTTEMSKFNVAEIEVWGLGGCDVLQDYLENKAACDYFKQERKVVDKSKFIKNDFDKEYLLGNTYSKGNSHSFN